MRWARSNNHRGFSVIEAILAGAVLALIITAVSGSYSMFDRSQSRSNSRFRAVLLADEGLEATRSMRDAAFSNLIDGAHGLQIAGGNWSFSGTQDITDGYTRTVAIAPVDATTKTVTATVTWSANGQSQSYTANTRLTNWRLPTQLSTTTTLSASPNPSTYGETVTLTATVSPAAATGIVTFMDGVATIGTGTISGGVATLTVSNLSVGPHSLTAVYSGDSTYVSSTSNAIFQTVNQNAAAVVLVSNPNPSSPTQLVTLQATINPITATGTVTFKDGPATIGTGTISLSVASMTTSSLVLGSHTLTAQYSGDTNNAPATSAPIIHVVALINTTTTLLSSDNPSIYSQPVTFTATVAPAAATGTVTLKDGITIIGTGTLSSGTATLTVSNLTAGSHSITAEYGGDTAYAASSSAVLTQQVSAGWENPNTLSGSLNLSGGQDGLKIAYQGNYVYIVRNGGTPNFAIVNISNPASPSLSGSLTLSGTPTNIAVSGNYAYITSTNNAQELQIINISDPSSPNQIGNYNASGNSDGLGIYIVGTTAYLTRATGSGNEFFTINISNPAIPTLLGSLLTSQGFNEVVVMGNYAYAAGNGNQPEVRVISVTNPASLSIVGSLNLSGSQNALTIAGSGSTIYVGRANDLLYTIGVSTPTAPVTLGTFDAQNMVNDVTVGTVGIRLCAFLATSSGAEELQVVDVTTPAAPSLIGGYGAPSNLFGIAYNPAGDRAYAVGASDAQELIIVQP